MNDVAMTDERKTRQTMFLKEFIGSFKGFQAGKVTIKEDQGMGNLETMDKCHFIRLGLARSAPETVIYEEVGIRGQTNHALPHGCIDLLSFAQTGKGSYLMLHCCGWIKSCRKMQSNDAYHCQIPKYIPKPRQQ